MSSVPSGKSVEKGVALLVVTGILALLAVQALAMSVLASHLRLRASGTADRMSARLAACSGTEYASARLAQDILPRRDPTAENQSDDWTYREGYSPLDGAANPSYAQTERYSDFTLNGRYDARGDGYVDANQNGRFDAWSGRLRGRLGGTGTVFLLRIAGAHGGLSVNDGVLGAGDRNGNGIPDGRDLDASGACAGSSPNRRAARALNHLGGILGISETVGDLIIGRRPVFGYASLDQLGDILLGAGLPPQNWGQLRLHVTVGQDKDPAASVEERIVDPVTQAAYRTGRLFREPRAPVNVNTASREALAALQEGLSCHSAAYEYVWEGLPTGNGGPVGLFTDPGNPYGDAIMMLPGVSGSGPPIHITRRDALNVGAFFASGRPFESRYALFRGLDAKKDQVFVDAYDSQARATIDTHTASGIPEVEAVVGKQNIDYAAPAELTRNQFVNLVAGNANPARLGTWPAWDPRRAARGPYSFLTYDVSRWHWSDGDDRLPRCPEAEEGETAELELEPDGCFRVESLGRVASGGGILARKRVAATLHVIQHVRSRSQADFENLEGNRSLPVGVALLGDPFRSGIQSSPLFSLRSCRDLQAGAGPGGRDPRYRFHDFIGDLRLMDDSNPDLGSPLLYFPFWEIEQPDRASKTPAAQAAFASSGSPLAASSDGLDSLRSRILTPAMQGAPMGPGRAGGHLYRWGAPGQAENEGDIPWTRGGMVPEGAVEFWTDGSACSQMNPLGATFGPHPSSLTITAPEVDVPIPSFTGQAPVNVPAQAIPLPVRSPLVLAWDQKIYRRNADGTSAVYVEHAESPRAFQQGEWHHAAFAFDSQEDEGAVRGYLDGILVFTAAFHAQAVDTASVQDLVLGREFLQPLAGTAGVDDVRLYGSPGSVDGVVQAHALQPRFQVQGEFRSPLHVLPASAWIDGARWDPFVPRALQPAVDPFGAASPLRAWLLLYADAEGERLLRDVELDPTGLWRAFLTPGVRAYRYHVRMDAGVAEPLRDTPVFEGIAVAFHRGRRLVEWSEDTEDPLERPLVPPPSLEPPPSVALPDPPKPPDSVTDYKVGDKPETGIDPDPDKLLPFTVPKGPPKTGIGPDPNKYLPVK